MLLLWIEWKINIRFVIAYYFFLLKNKQQNGGKQARMVGPVIYFRFFFLRFRIRFHAVYQSICCNKLNCNQPGCWIGRSWGRSFYWLKGNCFCGKAIWQKFSFIARIIEYWDRVDQKLWRSTHKKLHLIVKSKIISFITWNNLNQWIKDV